MLKLKSNFKMTFFEIIKAEQKDITEAEKNLFMRNEEMWDPSFPIDYNLARSNCAIIEAKLTKLKQNPKKISTQFTSSYIVGGIGTSIGLVLIFFFSELMAIGFMIMFLSWAYYGVLSNTYHKLVVDLIKLQIAKTKGWIYNPNNSELSWKKQRSRFPELFALGDENQYLEDQFWGKTKLNSKEVYFHSGLFSYDIVTRDSKGRSSRTTYKKHFISVYNEKEIKTRFKLSPETVFNKIGDMFSKKEINTESNEFNKTFAFSYVGSKENESQNIVKVLSPAVQDKLLTMKQRKGIFSALFSNHVVIFMFDGILFKQLSTNFKKSLEINSKDSEFLDKELSNVIDISNEVMQYLD